MLKGKKQITEKYIQGGRGGGCWGGGGGKSAWTIIAISGSDLQKCFEVVWDLSFGFYFFLQHGSGSSHLFFPYSPQIYVTFESINK